MLQRLRHRFRGPRDEIPAPDRLRLLVHVWRGAIEREDHEMATRAWLALRREAEAVRADDVLAAMLVVERFRNSPGAWSPASTTLQFAVARFASGGDPAISARFVIQDLTVAAATSFRATRLADYLAKLDAIRAAAERTGFHEIRDGADALLHDFERLVAWRDTIAQRHAVDGEETFREMARAHDARISALTATVWRES